MRNDTLAARFATGNGGSEKATSKSWKRIQALAKWQHRAGTCHTPLYLRVHFKQKAEGVWWRFGAVLSAPLSRLSQSSSSLGAGNAGAGNPVALVPHLQLRPCLPRPRLAWMKVKFGIAPPARAAPLFPSLGESKQGHRFNLADASALLDPQLPQSSHTRR